MENIKVGLIRTRSCPVERVGEERVMSDSGWVLPSQRWKLEQWERVRVAFEEELAWAQELSDPLEVSIRYVEWWEGTISDGVACPTQLVSILRRACQEFLAWPQYRQDIRYLKLWLKYIGIGGDPGKVFNFLFTYGVGDQLAVRYEEEAYYLESVGRYEEATQVYERGIQFGAEPQLRLARSYGAFKLRQTTLEVTSVQPEDSELGLLDTKEVLPSIGGGDLTPPCKPMKILRDPLGVTSHIFKNRLDPSPRHRNDSGTGRGNSPKPTRPLPLTSSVRLSRAEDFPQEQVGVKKQRLLKRKCFSKNLLSPPSPLPSSSRRSRPEPPLPPSPPRPLPRSASVTHPATSLPPSVVQPPPRTTSNLARYPSVHYRSFSTLGTAQVTPVPLVDTNLFLLEDDDDNPRHLELSPSEAKPEAAYAPHPTGLLLHTTHIYRSPTAVVTTASPPNLDNLDRDLLEDEDGDTLPLFLSDPPSPL